VHFYPGSRIQESQTLSESFSGGTPVINVSRVVVGLCAATLLFLSALAQAQTEKPASPPPSPAMIKSVEMQVRNLFSFGPEFTITLGTFTDSPLPEFYDVPISITYQGQTQEASIYLSRDGKYIIRGQIYDTTVDSAKANLAILKTEGNPSKGPADAKVTVVEFSDFQCSHCRVLYQTIKELAPQFPQVRWVFENFPIVKIHPWAMNAALAGRCVYDHNHDGFWQFHDAVYENQASITPENAQQKLEEFAVAAGLPAPALATCMANPLTQAAVDQNILQAKQLQVDSTPTLYVNGRSLIGGERFTLQQYLNFALSPQIMK
jgi:protein-disulfide isomerase